MSLSIVCQTDTPTVLMSSGDTVAVDIVAAASTPFHANAADLVVEFDSLRLAFVGFTTPDYFPDARLFGLYEKVGGIWRLDKTLTDGDLGVTAWAAMMGSDVTRYPAVVPEGLLVATLQFRPIAAGEAFVRLSANPARHATSRTKLYDASVPNYQRFADVMLGAVVEIQ